MILKKKARLLQCLGKWREAFCNAAPRILEILVFLISRTALWSTLKIWALQITSSLIVILICFPKKCVIMSSVTISKIYHFRKVFGNKYSATRNWKPLVFVLDWLRFLSLTCYYLFFQLPNGAAVYTNMLSRFWLPFLEIVSAEKIHESFSKVLLCWRVSIVFCCVPRPKLLVWASSAAQ